MPLDPGEHSVRELRDELGEIEDGDELANILSAEQNGKARKTAITAIEGRLNAVSEAEADAGAAEIDESASGGEDDVEAAEGDEAAEDAQEAPEDDADGGPNPLDRSSPNIRR